MTDSDELTQRLDSVEAMLEERPGQALEELEAVVGDLEGVIAIRQEQAGALLRNEDFSGAAKELSEAALVLQRTATAILALREEIRRRR